MSKICCSSDRERDDTREHLQAFRQLCRADAGALAGAEARALHATLDAAHRQASLQKTLALRASMRSREGDSPLPSSEQLLL